ncbi:MAG TPA: SPASM domain-containing protein [Herpetosiphonaceae bacterium]
MGTNSTAQPARNYLILADQASERAPANDCNCACPSPPTSADRPTQPAGAMLRVATGLRLTELDAQHLIAFVPSFSKVAVINEATQGLLGSFATGRSLAGATEAEQAAASRLYELGLLQAIGDAPSPPGASPELIAWMHVTNACNLRCTYCYLDKTNEAMSAETGLQSVAMVFRMAQTHGYRRVLFKYAGGEASLNLPLVKSLHQHARSLSAETGIELDGVVLSNGLGLTQGKLAVILDLGLRLMISLDGLAAYHDAQRPTVNGKGSHRAVSASIERAQAMGVPLSVSITITEQSVAGLGEVVAWLLAREIHFTLNFYRENECSSSREELRLNEQHLIDGMEAVYAVIQRSLPAYSLLGCLLDRANLTAAHGRPCAVGENYLVIDHYGNIAKCQMEIERPVATIWDQDPLLAIRIDPGGVQNMRVEAKSGCKDCEWRYWCAGGCPIATFRATGRYDVQSPNCGIYKALYPSVLRLEGLRLLRQGTAHVSATRRPMGAE